MYRHLYGISLTICMTVAILVAVSAPALAQGEISLVSGFEYFNGTDDIEDFGSTLNSALSDDWSLVFGLNPASVQLNTTALVFSNDLISLVYDTHSDPFFQARITTDPSTIVVSAPAEPRMDTTVAVVVEQLPDAVVTVSLFYDGLLVDSDMAIGTDIIPPTTNTAVGAHFSGAFEHYHGGISEMTLHPYAVNRGSLAALAGVGQTTRVSIAGQVSAIEEPPDHPFWGDYRVLVVDDGSAFPSGVHSIICPESCTLVGLSVGDMVVALARLDSTFGITGILGDPTTQLVLLSVKSQQGGSRLSDAVGTKSTPGSSEFSIFGELKTAVVRVSAGNPYSPLIQIIIESGPNTSELHNVSFYGDALADGEALLSSCTTSGDCSESLSGDALIEGTMDSWHQLIFQSQVPMTILAGDSIQIR